MPEVAAQTLEIAGRELNATLNEARTALEGFVEQPDNGALLERCATELHRAQGVLRVLEIYGGALLAEEMEHVARYMLASLHDRKNHAESLDALMRSVVQLPSYLDRVLAGGRDLALVLLPLLNDLRAVRGNPLLSEGALLLLNLKSDRKPEQPAVGGATGQSAQQWARRLRAEFQTGLIGWIRGENPAANLRALARVAEKLERASTQQSSFQLWWVTGAVIEALIEGGLDGGVSVKRLLGLADREIRRLYELGEEHYTETPPVELLNNLLYYVARARSEGPLVTAVRASFRLDELLPVDPAVEEERETLSAPSVKLMLTVAGAIREDLGKIKDALDIFMRRGAGQPEELAAQAELLRKIGDTLGVLGLGELRALAQRETARLGEIATGRLKSSDALLVEVATTLIGIEEQLDSSLLNMIVPRKPAAAVASPDAAPAEAPPGAEFAPVQAAVLRECIVNLARIKDAVAQNMSGTLDAAALDSWPELMRGIRAGLLMLGRLRAAGIIEKVTELLRRVMQPGGATVGGEFLERLADTVVSLEYYMETLQAGRSEPHYMLDNAQVSLDALAAAPTATIPTVAPVASEEVYARTVRLADMPPRVLPEPVSTVDFDPGFAASDARASATVVLQPEPAVATQPPVLTVAKHAPADDEEVDPEVRAIFVEEAREEAARILREFPAWDENPAEVQALVNVRRSFHTLKGSGRMVRAREIAEFAWAVENLLNRVLDGTLERSGAILGCLRAAVAATPRFVAQLEQGGPQATDVAALITQAHALAAGQESGTAAPEEPVIPVAQMPPPQVSAPRVEAATPRARPPEPADRSLADIYLRETNAHVATVLDYVARARARPGPHPLSEEAYRACHTLSGSSKMAEARHGIRLAEPVDRWLRKAYSSGIGLSDSDLTLLADCMRSMQQVASHLDEDTAYFATHDELRTRVAAAEAQMDERVVAAAETQESATGVFAAVSAAPGSAAAAAGEPRLDPDITGIFVEEAQELIEAAESALNDWRADRADGLRLARLKRPLHTLKGGARMAGLRSIGDLSHELETLIGQIEYGQVAADERAERVMQSSIDELARMRETVAGGRAPQEATELITNLRALARGSTELVVAAAEATPVAAQALRAVLETRTPAARPEPEPPPALLPAPEPEPEPMPTVARMAPVSPPGVAPALPPGREPAAAGDRPELARVDAELLDLLLNNAGEVSIGRARLEQQIGAIDHNLGELSRTVTRLKDQLRKLEIETEKQILHRFGDESGHRSGFDPLELDRYSAIQQFSRALVETASDVGSIQQLLATLTQDTQNLLQQQARTVTELQNGLMRTRMVPFQRYLQRLARIVRQAASDTGKQAELSIEGGAGEIDRQVLERMLPPFEHILRNAVVHGIEAPEERTARGKDETGRVSLELRRDGAEVILEISDDGAGMNLKAIRDKAAVLGMIAPGEQISDNDAMQLVLEPGFSTASAITQNAGRGVGMDVVATEIKKLGGALHMETQEGQGTRFTIRLPFTLAISHALVVRTADEYYALPLPTVEGVVRLSRDEVERHLASDIASFEYGGQKYRFQPLAHFVGLEPPPLPAGDVTVPVVLVRAGDHSTGIVTDELIGSREIVVKTVGPQVSAIRGISGATILGDGRIVVILDIGTLVRGDWRARSISPVVRDRADTRPVALVVDDSITVRRVTQRLLERNGMRVRTARDGMDAVGVLAESVPDIILLDVEMPRMDGYEVAAFVRNDPRLAGIPIIMITSRTGEKHRARAIELGVDDYLGKPYQEAQLLEAIEPLVQRRREQLAAGAQQHSRPQAGAAAQT